MPTKVTSWKKGNVVWQPGNVNVALTTYNATSNTTITSGKKDLRAQNPYKLRVERLLRSSQTFGDAVYAPKGPYGSWEDRLKGGFGQPDQIAYAKFWGKLRYGSANLGVTIGEWKSSSDMIYNRSLGLIKALDRANREILRDRKLLAKIRKRGVLTRDIISSWDEHGNVSRLVDRKIDLKRRKQLNPGWSLRPGAYVKKAADLDLEVTFGWQPLVQDVHTALTTVMKDGIPDSWIQSRGKAFFEVSERTDTSYENQTLWAQGVYKTTYCANVVVSNPNLWLLNRMGLINPAVVAWDLVPWSFVVGMFVNVNQMLMSMTNEVGLTLTNQSVTRTSKRIVTQSSSPGSRGFARTSASSTWLIFHKDRSSQTALRPKLEFHVPELNLELLVTTTALVVQRMSKLAKLLS